MKFDIVFTISNEMKCLSSADLFTPILRITSLQFLRCPGGRGNHVENSGRESVTQGWSIQLTMVMNVRQKPNDPYLGQGSYRGFDYSSEIKLAKQTSGTLPPDLETLQSIPLCSRQGDKVITVQFTNCKLRFNLFWEQLMLHWNQCRMLLWSVLSY